MAAEKIKNWCAYQERSQHETRQKLYSYGMSQEYVESIIADLISENYINEERFSMAYAGGKFRIKRWGKNKIKMALRQHQISDYCIKKALAQIDDDSYTHQLCNVIEKKMKLVGSGSKIKIFQSVLKHAVAKGYESDLVIGKLNVILKDKK
jgi:regulatory protein